MQIIGYLSLILLLSSCSQNINSKIVDKNKVVAESIVNRYADFYKKNVFDDENFSVLLNTIKRDSTSYLQLKIGDNLPDRFKTNHVLYVDSNTNQFYTLNTVNDSLVLNQSLTLKYHLQKDYVIYEVDPKKITTQFYLKDSTGNNISNAKNLKALLKEQGEELVFAVNGGMYLKDQSPQGLYIEKGEVIKKLNNVQDAYGNFYMQPNGIFLINKDKSVNVISTKDFMMNDNLDFATQSGPMLLIDGEMHPKFMKGSKNTHVRNGVGVLQNGNLIFIMSKTKVNFYDFAKCFKNFGCKNALYLDGFVSRTYLPKIDWQQTDGNFGVIIGVSKR